MGNANRAKLLGIKVDIAYAMALEEQLPWEIDGAKQRRHHQHLRKLSSETGGGKRNAGIARSIERRIETSRTYDMA